MVSSPYFDFYSQHINLDISSSKGDSHYTYYHPKGKGAYIRENAKRNFLVACAEPPISFDSLGAYNTVSYKENRFDLPPKLDFQLAVVSHTAMWRRHTR